MSCRKCASANLDTILHCQAHTLVRLAPKQLSHLNSIATTWLSCGCLQLFMLFLAHAYGGRMLELKPKPKSIMEGPWHKYWPCLLPWLAMQVVMSISWLHTVGNGRSSNVHC